MISTFERQFRRTPGCWIWTGTGNRGRGMIYDERIGKARLAHRVAWERANRPIPTGMLVCHHCDNPGCVRPDHLFLGTQRDNMRDATAKGRHVSRLRPDVIPKGTDHWKARLTPELVRWIRRVRARGWTQPRIAAAIGVSRSAVLGVLRGDNWSWVR